jgi:hypothetical protein
LPVAGESILAISVQSSRSIKADQPAGDSDHYSDKQFAPCHVAGRRSSPIRFVRHAHGMPHISANIIERALARLLGGDTYVNVAAVFVGEITANDQDGASWRFYLTDGVNEGGLIDATVAGTRGGHRGMAIDADRMERAIERRAGNFAVETRLRDMLAASPLTVEHEDVTPEKTLL